MIPSFDLKAQCAQLKPEMLAAIERVIDSGHFILGPEVKAFEAEFIQWNGAAHGCSVASGTDAIHLACKSLQLKPGDEVICPAFSYMATASAISLAGGTPVFVDVEPDTWNLNVSLVEQKISAKTRAVIAVHLYGNPCDILKLKSICERYQLVLIEDCAQAVGASVNGKKVGTFGDFGCFSFFPTKNLGGYGDGGFVIAGTQQHASKIRSLRAQGQDKEKYFHDRLGTNSRLDEMQAAILRVKLPHLTKWGELRQSHAKYYNDSFREIGSMLLPLSRPDHQHVFHQYTILVNDRDAVQQQLKLEGVGSTVYYPRSLHLQNCYKFLGYKENDMPVSERLQSMALSLPMFPELSKDQLEQSAKVVNSVLSKTLSLPSASN